MWGNEKQKYTKTVQRYSTVRACNYSRTSLALPLMARLPWLFRTRSWVRHINNPITADIIVLGIISGNFLS